jgi:hypothetical protein
LDVGSLGHQLCNVKHGFVFWLKAHQNVLDVEITMKTKLYYYWSFNELQIERFKVKNKVLLYSSRFVIKNFDFGEMSCYSIYRDSIREFLVLKPS